MVQILVSVHSSVFIYHSYQVSESYNNNDNNNNIRLYLKRVTHLVTKLIFHEAL